MKGILLTLRKTSILAVAVTMLFGVATTGFAIDHSLFISEYEGAKTCERCHEGYIEELQQTVHYRFESSVPENYLYDEEGHPRDIERSGKLWKLCGFPTTMPQFNWLGKLKDLPETQHIDSPGGCAKCHIGVGIKPYTAVGQTEPQENEANNVDCLVCHAENYNRKFYVATLNGEPELKSDGTPIVMAVPKVDGVLDFSVFLTAAQSVGKTKSDYCNRCHAAAGGGRVVLDDMEYSLKRGSIFDEANDVHAAKGLTCANCHSAGDHKTKRSFNNDIYAYDTPPVKHQMCIDCHTDAPHKSAPMINLHSARVSCTACHARSNGGGIYKDYADIIAPDPDNPLGLYNARVDTVSNGLALEYRWFSGKVHGEIEPMGSRTDGKIYPYKIIGFNQPVDENGHPVPVKWGKIFLTGDVETAAQIGRGLYESMYSEELAVKTGLPPVPGEFVEYKASYAPFSISHGITKDKALRCTECHSEDGPVDFAALGYSTSRVQQLTTMEVQDPDTFVSEWSIYQ